MPCTTSSATSSSTVPAWVAACRSATAGLSTTSATNTSGSPSPPTFWRPPRRGRADSPIGAAVAGPLIGGDDVGHDLVADDVGAGQMDEGEAVDAGQHALQADETAAATGHVDLR